MSSLPRSRRLLTALAAGALVGAGLAVAAPATAALLPWAVSVDDSTVGTPFAIASDDSGHLMVAGTNGWGTLDPSTGAVSDVNAYVDGSAPEGTASLLSDPAVNGNMLLLDEGDDGLQANRANSGLGAGYDLYRCDPYTGSAPADDSNPPTTGSYDDYVVCDTTPDSDRLTEVAATSGSGTFIAKASDGSWGIYILQTANNVNNVWSSGSWLGGAWGAIELANLGDPDLEFYGTPTALAFSGSVEFGGDCFVSGCGREVLNGFLGLTDGSQFYVAGQSGSTTTIYHLTATNVTTGDSGPTVGGSESGNYYTDNVDVSLRLAREKTMSTTDPVTALAADGETVMATTGSQVSVLDFSSSPITETDGQLGGDGKQVADLVNLSGTFVGLSADGSTVYTLPSVPSTPDAGFQATIALDADDTPVLFLNDLSTDSTGLADSSEAVDYPYLVRLTPASGGDPEILRADASGNLDPSTRFTVGSGVTSYRIALAYDNGLFTSAYTAATTAPVPAGTSGSSASWRIPLGFAATSLTADGNTVYATDGTTTKQVDTSQISATSPASTTLTTGTLPTPTGPISVTGGQVTLQSGGTAYPVYGLSSDDSTDFGILTNTAPVALGGDADGTLIEAKDAAGDWGLYLVDTDLDDDETVESALVRAGNNDGGLIDCLSGESCVVAYQVDDLGSRPVPAADLGVTQHGTVFNDVYLAQGSTIGLDAAALFNGTPDGEQITSASPNLGPVTGLALNTDESTLWATTSTGYVLGFPLDPTYGEFVTDANYNPLFGSGRLGGDLEQVVTTSHGVYALDVTRHALDVVPGIEPDTSSVTVKATDNGASVTGLPSVPASIGGVASGAYPYEVTFTPVASDDDSDESAYVPTGDDPVVVHVKADGTVDPADTEDDSTLLGLTPDTDYDATVSFANGVYTSARLRAAAATPVDSEVDDTTFVTEPATFAPTAVEIDDATGSAVTSTTHPKVGDTLTGKATFGSDDQASIDAGTATSSYLWYAGGSRFATGANVTLTSAQSGKAVTVRAEVAEPGHLTTLSDPSDPTGTVASASTDGSSGPSPTGSPSATPTAKPSVTGRVRIAGRIAVGHWVRVVGPTFHHLPGRAHRTVTWRVAGRTVGHAARLHLKARWRSKWLRVVVTESWTANKKRHQIGKSSGRHRIR